MARILPKGNDNILGLNMNNIARFVLIAVLTCLTTASAFAVSVPWTGLSDFDNSDMSFNAVHASHLTFTTPRLEECPFVGLGCTAEYHSHGGLSIGILDLLLDNVWTTVYSGSVDNDAIQPLDTLAIDFSPSSVTGAYWHTPTPQYVSFHNFINVTFDFSEPSADSVDVPEPTTIALFGLGLLGVAMARRRAA